MRMRIKNIVLKSTLLLLAGVMVLLIANNSIYMHTHINEQGKLITHAHPFNKTTDNKPIKSHQHTNAEYFYYDNLKNLHVLLGITFCFTPIVKSRFFTASKLKSSIKAIACINIGRAPPVLA